MKEKQIVKILHFFFGDLREEHEQKCMEFEVKLLQTYIFQCVSEPRYGEEDAWGLSQMDRKRWTFCWDLENQNGQPVWVLLSIMLMYFASLIGMHSCFPTLLFGICLEKLPWLPAAKPKISSWVFGAKKITTRWCENSWCIQVKRCVGCCSC